MSKSPAKSPADADAYVVPEAPDLVVERKQRIRRQFHNLTRSTDAIFQLEQDLSSAAALRELDAQALDEARVEIDALKLEIKAGSKEVGRLSRALKRSKDAAKSCSTSDMDALVAASLAHAWREERKVDAVRGRIGLDPRQRADADRSRAVLRELMGHFVEVLGADKSLALLQGELGIPDATFPALPLPAGSTVQEV